MTALEPIVAPTNRYTIAETAKILGIHRNTLRMHTESGLIKCGYRKTNARRFYTGMEIMKYWKSQL